MRNQEPKEEVQIYTWPDATLREITELVKEVVTLECCQTKASCNQMAPSCSHAVSLQVNPAAKRMNARLEFSFVYPDKRGRNVMRVVSLQSLHQTLTSLPSAHNTRTHVLKHIAKCSVLYYKSALFIMVPLLVSDHIS